jgi:hypothetical protein
MEGAGTNEVAVIYSARRRGYYRTQEWPVVETKRALHFFEGGGEFSKDDR